MAYSRKRFVGFVTPAADLIEKLYAEQEDTFALREKLADADPASKSLFFRNQSPRCEAPQTQADPACTAITDLPKGKLSGLYPAALLEKPKFCDELAKKEKEDKDDVYKNKSFMTPFTVVTAYGGKLKAVPSHEAFKADVGAISGELKAAAEALGNKEPALKAYPPPDTAPPSCEPFPTTLAYSPVSSKAGRMEYAEAIVRDYPIGTGITEAAAKTVVGTRMKRAGARFSQHGGQAVMLFRTALLSSCFEALHRKPVSSTYAKPVREAA